MAINPSAGHNRGPDMRFALWTQHGLHRRFEGYDPNESAAAAVLLDAAEEETRVRGSYLKTLSSDLLARQYGVVQAITRLNKDALSHYVSGCNEALQADDPEEELKKLAVESCFSKIVNAKAPHFNDDQRSAILTGLSDMLGALFEDIDNGYRPGQEPTPGSDS